MADTCDKQIQEYEERIQELQKKITIERTHLDELKKKFIWEVADTNKEMDGFKEKITSECVRLNQLLEEDPNCQLIPNILDDNDHCKKNGSHEEQQEQYLLLLAFIIHRASSNDSKQKMLCILYVKQMELDNPNLIKPSRNFLDEIHELYGNEEEDDYYNHILTLLYLQLKRED